MPPFFISRNMKSLRERKKERKKERKGEKSGTRYKEEDTLSSPGPRNSITKKLYRCTHNQDCQDTSIRARFLGFNALSTK